jgi:DnaJ-class molecular chaperone
MLQLQFVDHYRLLGVSEAATQAEIRVAYDHAIKQLPDRRFDCFLAGLAGRTKERYRAAYEELSDIEMRKKYDQYLEQSRKMIIGVLH